MLVVVVPVRMLASPVDDCVFLRMTTFPVEGMDVVVSDDDGIIVVGASLVDCVVFVSIGAFVIVSSPLCCGIDANPSMGSPNSGGLQPPAI